MIKESEGSAIHFIVEKAIVFTVDVDGFDVEGSIIANSCLGLSRNQHFIGLDNGTIISKKYNLNLVSS